MSADLLRRAAKVLRERAEAATAGPWEVQSYDIADTGHVEYMAVGPEDEHSVRVIPFRTQTEDAGHCSQAEADIAYGVLMHPPVALALAELLETLAAEPWASNQFDLFSAESLARTVLREVPR